ncbi:MAG: hypothetical protein K2W96_03585 [Gemmataceae bacterium]|nr:hypothetical protein [Gemmataceae bacterium]
MAACARQLLLDAGVEVPEGRIIERAGLIDGIGMFADRVAEALTTEHPRWHFDGGAISPAALDWLMHRGAWIANLRTARGTVHAVIVDKEEGGIVHVRDPWGVKGPGSGCGTKATMRRADIQVAWDMALDKVVFAAREKEER